MSIVAVPAQHFSGRGLFDRNKTLWMGFVIETPEGPIYFAGDTGFGPHFAQIQKRFGAFTLAMLPIGAFMPTEIMQHMHMNPRESLTAAKVLNARHSVGIHYGTFRLADDAEDEPARELKMAQDQWPDAPNFYVLDFGESRVIF